MIRLTTLKVNQVIIHEPHRSTFFSYDTPIASKYKDGTIECYEDWNYSRTTAKYRSKFLNESTSETRDNLRDGIHKYKETYA